MTPGQSENEEEVDSISLHTQSSDAGRSNVPSLSWSDIGAFAEALNVAQRELLSAAKSIREEFSLGPRGPWIVGLLAEGRICNQSDVVRRYKVGRSIIAEEMSPLVAAGLVTSQQSARDRRQVELQLTSRGRDMYERLGKAFSDVINSRLREYSRYDFLFCTRLLNDLAETEEADGIERTANRLQSQRKGRTSSKGGH